MKTDLHTSGTHRVPTPTPAPPAVQQKGEAFAAGLGVPASAFSGAHPVPHRRLERWKYTPVTGLLNAALKPSTRAVVEGIEPQGWAVNPVPGLEAYRVVFVNGFFHSGLSDLPVCEGVEVSFSNENETTPEDWMAELHQAMRPEGLTLRLAKGVVLDRPLLVHEVFTGEDEAAFATHSVELADHAQAEVVLWSSSQEGATGFSSSVWELSLGENAQLGLDVVQAEGTGVHRLVYTQVEQAASSRFRTHTATVSGDWVRNDLRIQLHGQGADAILHGLFLPLGTERVDNHTTVDHRVAHCTSSELYRGILYDRSTGVFNGKVFVRPDAQQTNAYQQSNNILASDMATMNAKPELEIYADDVQCSHGCTIGQLDEDALFYCKARGIDDVQAQALLVQAFIADVAMGFGNEEVRDEVLHLLRVRHGWLADS